MPVVPGADGVNVGRGLGKGNAPLVFASALTSCRLHVAVLVLAAGFLLAPAPTKARPTPSEARFPASISEQVMRELVQAGRVESKLVPGVDEAGQRWGEAAPEHQESALRAVVSALMGTRPPLSVAAAILAIARVESGWNASSKNPTSTACGIFQFVKATWKAYSDAPDSCYDPETNARAGVKHLTSIYAGRVRSRIEPLTLVTTESERVEWTFRLLYAYHYHGEASAMAPEGGALDAQSVAEAGVPPLKSFFSILKKATAAPARPRARGRSTRVARPKRNRG